MNAFERCGEFLAVGGPALFLRHTATRNREWKAFINFDQRSWFPAPNYVVMKLWREHYAPARVELDGDGRGLNAVATKSADGRTLYFKAVNPGDRILAVKLTVKEGFRVGAATMLQVAPGALESGNTLDTPDAVRPVPAAVEVSGQGIRLSLPRWSAAVVSLKEL